MGASSSFFTSMMIGAVGMGFFVYGKKQQRIPQLLAGLALMGYPYFVDDVLAMLAIGAVVLGAMYVAIRYGA